MQMAWSLGSQLTASPMCGVVTKRVPRSGLSSGIYEWIMDIQFNVHLFDERESLSAGVLSFGGGDL
jgi:hypothetical protein